MKFKRLVRPTLASFLTAASFWGGFKLASTDINPTYIMCGFATISVVAVWFMVYSLNNCSQHSKD